MVKAYLRYEQAAAWGVVATGISDTAGALAYVPASTSRGNDDFSDAQPAAAAARERLAVVALERVGIWDLKRGVRDTTLIPQPQADDHGLTKAAPRVTCVARSPNGDVVACGGRATEASDSGR